MDLFSTEAFVGVFALDEGLLHINSSTKNCAGAKRNLFSTEASVGVCACNEDLPYTSVHGAAVHFHVRGTGCT